MNVLAIDQGTSATKALVVGRRGRILAAAEMPVHPAVVDGGGVEQEPEALWTSVLDAAGSAIAQVRDPIGALALANQGETVLAWDRATGAPLSPAIVWQDRRSSAICDRLSSRGFGERLHALTGLRLDPYFVAPKIAWLRENVTRAGVATTTDAWLLYRLCGAFVTDASTASRTLLFDLDKGDWSEEACAAFGIAPDELPAIVDCAAVVGEARGLGASRAIPVAGLAVDQQAALFGESCFAAGEAKCTYGTGAFLLATLGSEPRRSMHGLAASVAWRLGGDSTYCLDGQVYTVGAAVRWLREIGLAVDPAELDPLAEGARAESGAIFVPGLAGLGAPFWRPEARGALVGLTLATGRAELVRAVLDGIACQVAWLARAAGDDLGRPLERLRVDGGLTRSRYLMQAQADLLQRPVELYPSPHATALGAAALARLGVGAAASAAEAVGPWQPLEIYAPRIGAAAAEERLQAWRRAVDATLGLT